ncbi:MAG: RdgB/HAM1 family non-canonical purine NTP pyrophosphatase [Novosphingobium aromaticivorans]|nr:RdgB/HAM1 family non-canonical purine NTP pyrophosphatase [Novosphingobium aromaticivorans]
MSRKLARRQLTPGKLVIATHNKGKLKEMQDLLAPFGMECLSAGELGLAEPEETGTTFVENALIKAHAAAQATGLPALSDDSGLAVAALGGAPGVYTADWAEQGPREGGPGRDWYMAMGKVEGKLARLGPDAPRDAAFHSVLALAWPDGEAVTFEGKIDGSLTWPPRGTTGFGYDPVFIPEGDTRTFSQLDPAEKNAISHRARAFAKLMAEQFAR